MKPQWIVLGAAVLSAGMLAVTLSAHGLQLAASAQVTATSEPPDKAEQAYLAAMHKTGPLQPTDEKAVYDWVVTRANAGDPAALAYMGDFSRYATYAPVPYDPVPYDPVQSAAWYQKAAEHGNARAMAELGAQYDQGLGVPVDHNHALNLYTKSARLGNKQGEYRLGKKILSGNGVNGTYAQAMAWLNASAQQNFDPAERTLGDLYLMPPDGSLPNEDLALTWYSKAADQDNTFAQQQLGWLYANGSVVPRNYVLARQWYEKAAAHGNTTAMVALGNLNYNGLGISKDLSQSFQWYSQAAQRGDLVGQSDLASLYANGEGVAQDWATAFSWQQKSAMQGYPHAQAFLGWWYHNGHSVPKNDILAYAWAKLAVEKIQSGWGEADESVDLDHVRARHRPRQGHRSGCQRLRLPRLNGRPVARRSRFLREVRVGGASYRPRPNKKARFYPKRTLPSQLPRP